MDKDKIIQDLKARGHRITKARVKIIEIFLGNPTPLLVEDISRLLKTKGVRANLTTVYREIDFLKDENLVKEIQFGEGKKRYEIKPDAHHHHLVCISCEKIDDVLLPHDLDRHEQKIAEQKKFQILNHSLEFFGRCANCQKPATI